MPYCIEQIGLVAGAGAAAATACGAIFTGAFTAEGIATCAPGVGAVVTALENLNTCAKPYGLDIEHIWQAIKAEAEKLEKLL